MENFNRELALSLLESTDEYPIDFENAWQWLGYSTKQKAQTKLTNNFEEGVDYTFNLTVKCHKTSPKKGSSVYNEIRLTVECLKSFGMMAGTEKGKEVRKYFLDCEKIAKQKVDSVSELEALAVTFTKLAQQERRIIEQERQAKITDSRLTAIECEQGRYTSPSGTKYTVLGYARKIGIEISASAAGQKGKKASSMCRDQEILIEQVYDPRFGYVNLYPETILIKVFAI